MKKFLAVIIFGLITWGTVSWVDFTKHTNWYYAGLIIGGILALALVALMIKVIFRLFKWMLTSCLYLSLVTITFGILTYTSILPVHIGAIGCILSSGLLTTMIIRRISLKSKVSPFFNELFSWITGYRVNLVQNDKPIKSVKTKEENPDRINIIKALQGMGYNKQEAVESADYAIEQKPDESLEDKLRCALTYIGSNKVLGEI